MDNRSHIGPEHFKALRWLPVYKRVEHISLCHVFKIKLGLSPDYLNENFVPLSSVHERCTRSRVSLNSLADGSLSATDNGRYKLPKVGSFGKKSFAFCSISSWNNLPQYLRSSGCLRKFKTDLKIQLMASLA